MLGSHSNTGAGLQTCHFIKKRLQYRCYFVKLCEIFKNTYFEEHLTNECFYSLYKVPPISWKIRWPINISQWTLLKLLLNLRFKVYYYFFCNFINKETLAQVFYCEFCEIFKNTFSYRIPPVFASEISPTCLNFLFFLVRFRLTT